MQYSFLSAAILALSSVVSAQTTGFDAITAPTQDQSVAAGTTLNIVWEPTNFTAAADTVTITLLQGATVGTLSLGPVITANIANSAGTYAWAIPTTLDYFPTYGFKISYDVDATIFQYSFPFHVTGLASSATAAGSVSPTTVTMHLSTGSAYSISSSSTILSNTTTFASSTSSYANTTCTTASVTSAVTPASNITVVSATITTQASRTSAIASQTAVSTSLPAEPTGAAVANVASGSLALFGGLLLALVL